MREPSVQHSSLTPSLPLTVMDVANHLGVSIDVVRDLLRKEKIRGGKVGGRWRIMSDDLAEYVVTTFE
jgi:excisionase family DNA binding protein